jgi:hypothetical protein
MVSLHPAGDGLWRSLLPQASGRSYRLCRNYSDADVCNWAIPEEDHDPLCRSCRLTRVIPDLGREGAQAAWYKLEAAKRRLIYSLMHLGVAVVSRSEDPSAASPSSSWRTRARRARRRITGHANGLITVNIAEADDAERERRRVQFREPYRTLLGHFRHEIGHYYWEWLIESGPRHEPLPGAVRRRACGLCGRAPAASRTTVALRRGRPATSRRTRAPTVGGLGRNVGALPPHDRHAGDGRRLRRFAASRGATTIRRSRPRRYRASRSAPPSTNGDSGCRLPICSTT